MGVSGVIFLLESGEYRGALLGDNRETLELHDEIIQDRIHRWEPVSVDESVAEVQGQSGIGGWLASKIRLFLQPTGREVKCEAGELGAGDAHGIGQVFSYNTKPGQAIVDVRFGASGGCVGVACAISHTLGHYWEVIQKQVTQQQGEEGEQIIEMHAIRNLQSETFLYLDNAIGDVMLESSPSEDSFLWATVNLKSSIASTSVGSE
eukprot:gnl/MRDRNA2_/MRDRNA2_22585_c0_seq1.p1 gnl/MRDRNA2_/MRDRNA2_22585_c0~~gnl/MRDRNA2_/MRDRNA2_22585_c0_seq1.p1  ORF type:complete len:206 (+),score=36.14 gnl/MRDRNA2_/MRDRNA2_22585_c0_seq1:315-932(+)